MKSPNIYSLTVDVKSRVTAWQIAAYYCENFLKKEFPFGNGDSWRKSLRIPVELYFTFSSKRSLDKFRKDIMKDFSDITVYV